MKKLFNPSTIAVIGATEKEGSVGRTVLENLVRVPERKVFPVNPKRKEVLGCLGPREAFDQCPGR